MDQGVAQENGVLRCGTKGQVKRACLLIWIKITID
jgi:hypothetical protein